MFFKKGQSAIEFLIIITGVLFFFLIFFTIMQNNIEEKYKEKNNLLIKQVAEDIQKEIDLAINSREGYLRTFEIPKHIGNKEYNATIQEEMIYLITIDKEHAIAIPTRKINGNIKIGENTINKKNGEVYLNVL